MINEVYLKKIYEFAKKKDYDKVREILNTRLFTYRQAMLYCENIKHDTKAAAYIVKQATCKCGTIVTKWQYNKTPTCSWCSFRKSIDKIEYGPKAEQNDHKRI